MNLPSLQGVHVLVVGDVMLDRYWSGPAHRVSQEAPVPVVHVDRIDEHPGGAANVALNVASLGATCTLVGVVGNDSAADSIIQTLTAAGVVCDLVRVEGWPTIVKVRVLSQNQQLLRTDFEQPLPADAHSAQAVVEKVKAHLGDKSVMVLQDYDKGALDDPGLIIAAAVQARVPVVADPKHKPVGQYAGVDLLKPNAQELQAAIGPWADDAEMVSKTRGLCGEHQLGAVVVTRGANGMTAVSGQGGHQQFVPFE